MYQKVDTSLNFSEREKDIIKFWKENDIFPKTMERTKGGKEFTFYDGPPTANGKPHIGHILTRVMKDIIPRFMTMKGCHCRRKAGWDTHGLPVELEVEKELGINGKPQIEEYGIEPFIKKCKESVWKYKSEWERMSERVGYWVDMDNPYITYDDKYIESVWWSLKEIFNRGLIYRGHKIVPYCPRCGTALSSHEVAQGYKDVKEKSIVVKFRKKDEDNAYFLAWTTTPWTLPSNVALCVNPDETYARISSGGSQYILAESLIDKHFTEYEIIDRKPGKFYERCAYVPLFDFADAKDAYYVTCDEFVTLSDGTGIVHIAPAFGEDDANVGRKYGLPFVQLVDERGNFSPKAEWLAGKFCKHADKDIIIDLKTRGLLLSEIMYEHSYPFCWRCDTPLLYYARSTWFIRMTELRDNLLKNNEEINWLPPSIGKGRFGNFLENVVDWGLSRERYWGTPLPLWVCPKCGNIHAVGSKEELKELGGIKGDIELHKPYVDKVEIKCSKCGAMMKRTPEVIDCWYDSGAMPFAQHHYPFENKDLFKETFPADFISEAVDQTRGWFYTLLAISTLMFDKPAFKNCLVLGHVCDEKGEKMSKHKGNVVDPWSVLNVQGADAVRWYFYTTSQPWLPSRFSAKTVEESQRKFLGTLWNTYSFYVLYAEIDKFDPTNYNIKDCKLTLMDKWILSELNALIKFVEQSLYNYQITESARAIQKFTDDLSNWYVRRCRERFWGSGMYDDKIAAFMTLYTVLNNLIRLAAPYVPFITETIYQNIVKSVDASAPESVHLCDYPVADESYINDTLDRGMQIIIEAAALGRSVRNNVSIKNRQPLSKLYLTVSTDKELIDNELLGILADELNVLSAEIIDDSSDFIKYDLKPQLRTLGPKYGPLLSDIRALLASDADKIMATVKDGGVFKTNIKGRDVELTLDDLLVNVISKEGFNTESANGISVILDTTLNDELIAKGYARELISKIQTMRKEAKFNITDHIIITYDTQSNQLLDVLSAHKQNIAADTLADDVINGQSKGYIKQWDINGHLITIGVSKVV